jgi:hypothetical protein
MVSKILSSSDTLFVRMSRPTQENLMPGAKVLPAENVCTLALLQYFCKGFLLVLLVFPLVTRRLEISHSLESVSTQGETMTTLKISGLEDTPDGVDETVKPDEGKSAELVN